MTVQTTSIDSYYQSLPQMPARELEALKLLEAAPRALCNREVSDLLGRPINEITPVVFRLRERGLVAESHRAKYLPTNRRVIYWKPAA